MARKPTPDDKYRIVLSYSGVPSGTELYQDEDEAKERFDEICSMKQKGYYSIVTGVRLERLVSFKLQDWKQVKKMHFLVQETTRKML